MKTSTETNIKIHYLNGWYQKDRIINYFFEYNYVLSNIFKKKPQYSKPFSKCSNGSIVC